MPSGGEKAVRKNDKNESNVKNENNVKNVIHVNNVKKT